MSRIEQLQKFTDQFKTTDLWKAMAKTKEDSPWHREDSVAIHTEMVLASFLNDVSYSYLTENPLKVIDESAFIVTYLSLLFHDTGKPPCKVVKFKEERGYYNAFHGHEIYSARLFEDYFVKNYKQFEGWLSAEEAYKVMWIIENHLPYDAMGNDKKMDYLRTALDGNLGEHWQCFGWHLLSDTYGRISDDAETKRAKTEEFVSLMNSATVAAPRIIKDDAPVLNLLVGASGSGKSTYVKKLTEEGFAHFSFDDIRVKLALENGVVDKGDPVKLYGDAFGYCDKHRSEFGHRADVEFIKLLKDYRSVVVDNTNVSRKARTKFVVEAKKRGYSVVATVFPVSLDTLLDRMHSRVDKNVPDDVVKNQYFKVSLPWVGVEVDSLNIVKDNLET